MFSQKFNSRFIQINFFIEGSGNRLYLCSNFLVLLCQMFTTLFSYGFYEFCFFLQGKQIILFFVCSRISWLYLTFLFRRERLSMFFLFGIIFSNTWAFWSGVRDLRYLCCAAEWFLSNRFLFSGRRDSCFFLCASASVCKILIFFSGGRDLHWNLCAAASVSKISTFFPGERNLHCFLCASVLLTKTCTFLSGEIDSWNCFTPAEFVFKFCLKKHSACFLIWADVQVLRTLAIYMQLLPCFSYSCINILFSSSVHLPLFILLFSNLGAAALSFKIRVFFLGGRDSWYFWCATASSSKIWAFFSRGRDSRYFWCAAASSSKIWAFFLGGRDSQYFFSLSVYLSSFFVFSE